MEKAVNPGTGQTGWVAADSGSGSPYVRDATTSSAKAFFIVDSVKVEFILHDCAQDK